MCYEIYEKTRKLIANPKKFFKTNKEDSSETTKYLAVIILVPAIYATLNIAMFGFIPSHFLLGAGMAIYIMYLIFFVIWTLIIHFMWKLIGGKAKFEDSYMVLVYGNAPTILLGWVPILNIVVGIYSIYLVVVGGSIRHNISYLRSALGVFILPLAIFAGMLLLIFSYFPEMYVYAAQMIESSRMNFNMSFANASIYY